MVVRGDNYGADHCYHGIFIGPSGEVVNFGTYYLHIKQHVDLLTFTNFGQLSLVRINYEKCLDPSNTSRHALSKDLFNETDPGAHNAMKCKIGPTVSRDTLSCFRTLIQNSMFKENSVFHQWQNPLHELSWFFR